eukprot:3821503-Amphidinium_carterae.2
MVMHMSARKHAFWLARTASVPWQKTCACCFCASLRCHSCYNSSRLVGLALNMCSLLAREYHACVSAARDACACHHEFQIASSDRFSDAHLRRVVQGHAE